MKTIVVIPDLQVPFHDKPAVEAVRSFIEGYDDLDELWCVGDEGDSPEPSRWSKGSAEEFADTFWTGVLHTRSVMRGFSEAAHGKPFHVMRSNHMDRIETYVRRYAPALTSLPQLRIESLYGYDQMANLTYHRKIWKGAPGWVMAHGDEGGMRQTAGGTAMGLSKKLGMSVVCGHTHRLGLQHEATGVNGQGTTFWGFEVGHLMDIRQASYLNTGFANWQQGFGILRVINNRVYPTPVAITNKSFVVDGDTYAW